eukprot:scaffold7647_cov403-Prasinococcus_capsulatus_cf.AAC.2
MDSKAQRAFAKAPLIESTDDTKVDAKSRGTKMSPAEKEEKFADARRIQTHWDSGSAKVFFERHMMFLDFPKVNSTQQQPAMVNQLRDPVDRCISRYNYEVDAKSVPPISLEDCMQKEAYCQFGNWTYTGFLSVDVRPKRRDLIMEECGSNYQVRWLCGMDEDCHPATEASLEKAIRHLEEYYRFVGILELGSLNLKLLAALLPSFFNADKVTKVYVNSTSG